MDSLMDSKDFKYNRLIRFLLERSLISKGQFEIIYTRKVMGKGLDYDVKNRSKGAYYRLLGQSRSKVESILYSILLLVAIDALDKRALHVMQQLIEQISIIASRDIDDADANDVISVIQELVKQISKDIVAYQQ
jgi:hypothetical protein